MVSLLGRLGNPGDDDLIAVELICPRHFVSSEDVDGKERCSKTKTITMKGVASKEAIEDNS